MSDLKNHRINQSATLAATCRGRRWRSLIGASLCAAMVAGLVTVSDQWAEAATSSATGNAGLASSLATLGAQIDQRTAEVRLEFPLASSTGPADSGTTVSALFIQSLAVAGIDRYSLGAGWTLGVSFVDVDRAVLVHGGAEYRWDARTESGLQHYQQRDVRFVREAGSVPGQELSYSYRLESLLDGRELYFDDRGDLIAVQDTFDHTGVLEWESTADGQHRLIKLTGPWGTSTTVDWSGSTVTFTPPLASGQERPAESTIKTANGRIISVTDALGRSTTFEWSQPIGDIAAVLPVAVVSPLGARTELEYTQATPELGSVISVSTAQVVDLAQRVLTAPIEISITPDTATANGMWNGCPTYCSVDGSDRVADSGDGDFHYRVRLTQGDQRLERTFNAVHAIDHETLSIKVGGQYKPVALTDYAYPGESADGAPPKASSAPANYRTPNSSTVTAIDPGNSERRTSVMATAEHDDLGRTVRQDDTAVVTTTEYGPNSIPLRTERLDRASGARQVIESKPTPDGRAIETTTVSAAANATDPLEVVSVTSFEYHGGQLAGELARTTTTAGSGPGLAGAGQSVSTSDSEIVWEESGAGVRRTTTTGPDGVATVVTSDLATGLTLAIEQAGQAGVSVGYDIGGRTVRTTSTDGLTTDTEYAIGPDGGQIVTQRRSADGLGTRLHTDELGRPVRTESNYHPESGTIDSWRTIAETEFDDYGRQTTMVDVAGRTTRAEYNALGEVVSLTHPDGTRVLTNNDSVDRITTTQTRPAGSDQSAVTSRTVRDARDNVVESAVAYGDGTPSVNYEYQFDAFGRMLNTSGSGAYAVESTYGNDDQRLHDVLTPLAADGGPQVTAGYDTDGFGNVLSKSLTTDEETVSSAAITYDAAGRPLTVTGPDGSVGVVITYDPITGAPATTVRADGSVSHRGYSPTGQLVESWISPAGSPDQREHHLKTTYDALTGQPAAIWLAEDEAGTRITFTYYPNGALATRTDPGGKTTSYTYTAEGNVHTVTNVTGATTTYDYDLENGRLKGAIQVRGEDQLASVAYDYDGFGRLAKIDRGTAGTTEYIYDDAGQTRSEKHVAADGTVVAEHAYTYLNGQLITDVATVDDGSGRSTTATRYTYQANRLVEARETRGSEPDSGELVHVETFEYDLATNLVNNKVTEVAEDGTETTTETAYRHAADSRTTTVVRDGVEYPQEYDVVGQLTTAWDGTVYDYNLAGQIEAITTADGERFEYTYRPTGERATQVSVGADGVRSTLTYHIGAEIDEHGTSATYLSGLTLESRTITATGGDPATTWYLTNRHGDKTHAVTGAGTIARATAFGPYGAVLASSGDTTLGGATIAADPYGFSGEFTGPTGLQPLGTRWYDAGSGTFTTADNPGAGMLNLYVFGVGDPVNQVDPTGRSPEQSWLSRGFNAYNEWGGTPIVNIGLAVIGVIATVASGGSASLIALAVMAGALTIPSAADEVARQVGGSGFMDAPTRTALNVVGTVAGVFDFGAGVVSAIRAYRATHLLDNTNLGRALSSKAPDTGAADAVDSVDDLNMEDLGTLRGWTTADYITFNDHLRGKATVGGYVKYRSTGGAGEWDGNIQNGVDSLNQTLRKLPGRPGVSYRGGTDVSRFNTNAPITAATFTSSSTNPAVAVKFARPDGVTNNPNAYVMAIESSDGRDISGMSMYAHSHNAEFEVLFGTGTVFQVSERVFEPTWGMWFVRVTAHTPGM